MHVINQRKESHGRESSLNKSLSAFCGCRPHAPICAKFSGSQMNMNPQTPRPLHALPPANRCSFGNHALENPEGSLRIACPQTGSQPYLRRRENQQQQADECYRPSLHGLHQFWFCVFGNYIPMHFQRRRISTYLDYM